MIHAHINKTRVIAACNNYLTAHKKRVEVEVEAAIASHMAPLTGFFAKMFATPPAKSREEAIARMKVREDFYSEWKWIHLEPTAVRNAKKMLALAEATELDFVVLDEDGQWILKHE